MQSLKAIRKRITSVKNTQKITKAMKMVAAAKLRKAQQAAVRARDYVAAVEETAGRLAANAPEPNPLTVFKEKAVKKDFVVLTSDRGLCGGFNSNLLRKTEAMLQKCREQNIRTEARLIGRKGRDYFKAKQLPVAEAATGLYENLDRKIAEELAKVAIHRFETGKTDEVWLVYNYFKSTLVQEATFARLLPFENKSEIRKADYIFEPNPAVVLDRLLREAVVSRIYSGLLESVASELAARMAAMDNATKNASDMINYLTLVFNRARQAAITKELMDIVGGAEVLRES